MMNSMILHVTYTCKPGMAEAFVLTIKEQGLQQSVQQEDGCMQYDYHLSLEAPDTVLLTEQWRDADALAVHRGQPTLLKIGALKEEYVLSVDVRRFQVTSV